MPADDPGTWELVGMALPLILVSRGAHNERQHASVLENAAAVQKIAVGSASTLAREPSLA
jgi:hypothetical protein